MPAGPRRVVTRPGTRARLTAPFMVEVASTHPTGGRLVVAYEDRRNYSTAEDARARADRSAAGAPIAVVEVGDFCDFGCPTCSADSVGAGTLRPAAEIVAEGLRETEPGWTVMLSGGEPFSHPGIIRIAARLLAAGRRVVLITNGAALASDEKWARRVLALGPGSEVYLQFDSLRAGALTMIRGSDLRQLRASAVGNLSATGVPFSLVSVVVAGVNDDEIPALVSYAWDAGARGITFQPIREVGRTDSGLGDRPLPLDFVRNAVRSATLPGPGPTLLTPHPRDPHYVWTGWIRRADGARFTPLADGGDTFFSPSTPEVFRVASVSYVDTHIEGAAPEGDLFRSVVSGTPVSLQRRYLAAATA